MPKAKKCAQGRIFCHLHSQIDLYDANCFSISQALPLPE
jgi:hypothetical protein